MFKFLSLFKRSSEEQLNDNDYDFNEIPVPEGQIPIRIDTVLGEQQASSALPIPTEKITSTRLHDENRISEVRAELHDLSDDALLSGTEDKNTEPTKISDNSRPKIAPNLEPERSNSTEEPSAPSEEPELPTKGKRVSSAEDYDMKKRNEDFNTKKGKLDKDLRSLSMLPYGENYTIDPELLNHAQEIFGTSADVIKDVIDFSQFLYQIQPAQRRIDSGHIREYRDMIQNPLIQNNLEQICKYVKIQTLDDLLILEKNDQATLETTLSFLKDIGSTNMILGAELFSEYTEAAKNQTLRDSINHIKDTFPNFSYRIVKTADSKILTDPYDAAARDLYLIAKNEQPDDLSNSHKNKLVRFLYENADKVKHMDSFYFYLTLANIEGRISAKPESLYIESQEGGRTIQKSQPITQESINQLISEGDQSKMFAYVYHLTDSYRYPVDTAIQAENLPKVHTDTNAATQILEHINDPVLKGLATARIFDILLDEKLGNIDGAEQFLAQIDNSRLHDSLGNELQKEQDRRVRGKTKAEEIFDKVTSRSKERLEKALHDRVKGDAVLPENKELLEQKARDYIQTQGVSINIGLDTLSLLLHDSRKFLSSWETNSKDERYNVLREKLEKKLGIFANGTHRDPSPIYAAVYAPNGHDEYLGPGSSYGDAFVILDKDRIKSRTTFSTDDSLDNSANVDPAHCNFTWEDAAYIKAAKDINRRQGKDYIEAQILGGVTVDDIASINIPLISQNGEPKPNADAIRARVEQLRQEFPNITFNLIEKMKTTNQ